MTSIGAEAFYNNKIETVVIPHSVTNIGKGAFRINNLTSLEISSKVIGDEAFINNKLTSLVLEEGVEVIGERAFDNIKVLSPIWYRIKDSRYSTVSRISNIEFPSSLKSINVNAFGYSTREGEYSSHFFYNVIITMNGTVPPEIVGIEESINKKYCTMFNGGCGSLYDVYIFVPKESENLYKAHPDWTRRSRSINKIDKSSIIEVKM